MAKKTTKQLLKSARQLLKRNWVEGSWVIFDDGDAWDPAHGWDVLKDKLKTQPNPDCQVCAEGAVYMACALAGEDLSTARGLIDDLNNRSDDMYGMGIIEVNDGWDPDEEDEDAGLNGVLKVFDTLEQESHA